MNSLATDQTTHNVYTSYTGEPHNGSHYLTDTVTHVSVRGSFLALFGTLALSQLHMH